MNLKFCGLLELSWRRHHYFGLKDTRSSCTSNVIIQPHGDLNPCLLHESQTDVLTAITTHGLMCLLVANRSLVPVAVPTTIVLIVLYAKQLQLRTFRLSSITWVHKRWTSDSLVVGLSLRPNEGGCWHYLYSCYLFNRSGDVIRTTLIADKTSNASSQSFQQGGHRDFKFRPQIQRHGSLPVASVGARIQHPSGLMQNGEYWHLIIPYKRVR